MGWTVIDSIQINSSTNEFKFSGLDFDKYKIYKIHGLFMADGVSAINPSIRINEDTGLNYDAARVAFVSGGNPYVYDDLQNYEFTPIASGFFGNEHTTIDCYLMKTPTELILWSKAFTDGSGSGDNHYFMCRWKSAAIVNTVTMHTDLVHPPSPPILGDCGYPTRLNLCVLN